MSLNQEIPLLGCGFVSLEGVLADDLSVVNSARVSFNQYHKDMIDGDDKLINFLMKHKHGTPFEHNSFRFRVKAPIFVFREWHRHRIGCSINEWSARYSELKKAFYIPQLENVRTQVGKPGYYTFEVLDSSKSQLFIDLVIENNKDTFTRYLNALDLGVAKEQARILLPLNIMSEMYWTCNARSLMNFLSLRGSDSKAQKEIQVYADAMESIFAQYMPITHDSFVKNNRIAP